MVSDPGINNSEKVLKKQMKIDTFRSFFQVYPQYFLLGISDHFWWFLKKEKLS